MIDSHCHLDFDEFKDRRDEAISEALSVGVHIIVNIGTDLETSRNSVQLADVHDCIYATVGVHPHDARKYNKETEAELVQLSDHRKVVAIGEIGLDYYRDLSPRNIQQRVFHKQLELAVEKKLPVVIHTREAFRETVEIVREYSHRLTGGLFHCFPGTVSDAYDVIDLGFEISFGGVITFPKAKMARVASEVPLKHILLETDSPYLAPVPFRGKSNQPAYVRFVRDKLAELRGITAEEVETITDRNSRKFFRLVDMFEG
ncbi:MAG: TatD family hydrolase [Candidatus Zixiibacteriota bacterium]|nr:MAG: TatD family hydrolase [candidate division Zixibacteria bacterium]